MGSAYLHEGNLAWRRVLKFAALLQNIDAHAKAPLLAELVGGKPAVSPHPTSGFRERADDLLPFVDEKVVPDGQHASPFAGPPMAGLADLPRPPWLFVTADESGATGELPFSGSTPSVVQAMLGKKDAPPSLTSLFQVMSNAPHPHLGSGALVLLKLGMRLGVGQADSMAMDLNRAEATEQTGFPLIGAWTQDLHSETTLAHVTFLPASLFGPGILEQVAFYSWLRNEWARQRLL